MKWVWCKLCETPAVICPHCGNNCCNGGSNEGCKDDCKGAYEYQQHAFDDGTQPSRDQCTDEIGDIDILMRSKT